MVCAIIVAGGEGKRAGYEIPKQFQKINGKSVLRITAEKFQNSCSIDKFIVIAHKSFFEETIEQVHDFDKLLSVVEGGDCRQQSVYNGLKFLKELKIGVTHVAIHDAVRPFVKIEKISECVAKAKEKGGAILAQKAEHSMSKVQNFKIKSLLNREEIYLHNTPQVFDFSKLLFAYSQVKDKLSDFTDDASIYYHCGFSIYIVEDDKNNIKLTTREDFLLAEYLLRVGL
ncbi:MAG TPA: 2-C-methyl-D-erythritol 4-phosphate cytidylyltransferase [Defluviitoga sp.]|nr:2-C-methyl-D-erythritol 4-phosphate cytidylyltransferase [Defluviitoga sp.]HOP24255.1 2-C-methyl-D-erythritol 4-phosphate cytidylyltransferase [Defluviitoga sp.]HPZ28153.1 2-C-methyl-D-erythritol 4-phosphate cytidylyltransferase [Defluviitoga sp.]HQD62043.1 2-C-methyl-D-erythritol 4-phosphate cytidylyltransferase [Defluviitoga sp.]